MPPDLLISEAERRAREAEDLPAFSGLKLAHIKRQITLLLALIGRNGIFDEYTVHDISHINSMLEMLDWIIPNDTKGLMSSSDWLLIVLAIYFHDLGMLVSRREYEQRANSSFPHFKESVLYAGDDGTNYKAKVAELSPEDSERFLYQEFVRYKHAERIKAWITGRPAEYLGVADRAFEEVDSLLRPLNVLFRRDLALVCESHHLDDLHDLQKYKASQPYGNTKDQAANVHYSAVLLRTVDLLHMTGDRTPSVAFRLIDPSDPVSQREWAKQMAVTAVRSKAGLDKEGYPVDNLPRNTVEVHAYFTKEDGFFALTSFLHYVADQLKKSHDWTILSNQRTGARHSFPWRFIDDSGIETEGFLKNRFSFNIDEAKILDLLTGHTLYNDTGVVIRELAQNSIDAIRLQHVIDRDIDPSAPPGSLHIRWSSKERILTVVDTGTGMTQNVIEAHLLRVGSSRYQDPDFAKQYPTFSPISRFGIGVLSTFMIADMVEILTSHPEDIQARRLSLRSVHGRYLISLVDKHEDPSLSEIAEPGTIIRLRLRASAPNPDVLAIARKWVIVPECSVDVQIDDGPILPIGFSSISDAVWDILGQSDIDRTHAGYKVEQWTDGGLTLAIALRWSDFFNEWEFFLHPNAVDNDDSGIMEERSSIPDFGICIEGVRVEFNTPGFSSKAIVALANAKGPSAPKTNVARSGLESTPQLTATIRALYSFYCNHVRSQMDTLRGQGYSLTWATREGALLLNPIVTTEAGDVVDEKALQDEVSKLPLLIVEEDGNRKGLSAVDLNLRDSFWTVDSELFRSAEAIMSEAPGDVSLSVLISLLSGGGLKLPDGLIVCGGSAGLQTGKSAFYGKEVQSIQVHRTERRVDIRWTQIGSSPLWLNTGRNFRYSTRFISAGSRRRKIWANDTSILVGKEHLDNSGLTNESAVRANGFLFLLPHTDLATHYVKINSAYETNPSDALKIELDFLGWVILNMFGFGSAPDHQQRNGSVDIEDILDLNAYVDDENIPRPDVSLSVLRKKVNSQDFRRVIEKTPPVVFDTSAWTRWL